MARRSPISSEKVYVKPHDLPATGRQGRGERGQGLHRLRREDRRGRVVNRSGNLVGQAFIAGVLGGRGFSTNSSAYLTSPTVSVNGQRPTLSPSDIVAGGGLGQGVAQSGDMVSKYLIERAEQYQPVVEMPTGLDVEVGVPRRRLHPQLKGTPSVTRTISALRLLTVLGLALGCLPSLADARAACRCPSAHCCRKGRLGDEGFGRAPATHHG
jgi:hypothetical protein